MEGFGRLPCVMTFYALVSPPPFKFRVEGGGGPELRLNMLLACYWLPLEAHVNPTLIM